ncbi:single-stranded DNA-binding protein [Streptomyces sp. I6]|uniref:single-stranded DNA-binding protein n=1 Tax=Streptomyces sp. I6 TaxID=2483113 RepID=UPI000F44C59D|nr:single-stranded DNA-binding protein [Streptomyces sp. I6]
MTDVMVTLTGNVATAVEYRDSATGGRARFRFAVPSRRWDRQRDGWTDGPTSFYTVWAWRALGANLAASVAVGEPLVVQGRLRVREEEWEGKLRTSVDIDAVAAGHDLARGTSAFRRVTRSEARLTSRQAVAAAPASVPPAAAAESPPVAVPPATVTAAPASVPAPPSPTAPAESAPSAAPAGVGGFSAPPLPASSAAFVETAEAGLFGPDQSGSAGRAPDRLRSASGRARGRPRSTGTARRESVSSGRGEASGTGSDARAAEPAGVPCKP